MISGDRFDEFARWITLRTESLATFPSSLSVPLALRSPPLQLCNKKSPKFDLSIHRNRDVLNFSPILVASNSYFNPVRWTLRVSNSRFYFGDIHLDRNFPPSRWSPLVFISPSLHVSLHFLIRRFFSTRLVSFSKTRDHRRVKWVN